MAETHKHTCQDRRAISSKPSTYQASSMNPSTNFLASGFLSWICTAISCTERQNSWFKYHSEENKEKKATSMHKHEHWKIQADLACLHNCKHDGNQHFSIYHTTCTWNLGRDLVIHHDKPTSTSAHAETQTHTHTHSLTYWTAYASAHLQFKLHDSMTSHHRRHLNLKEKKT